MPRGVLAWVQTPPARTRTGHEARGPAVVHAADKTLVRSFAAHGRQSRIRCRDMTDLKRKVAVITVPDEALAGGLRFNVPRRG